MFSLPKLLMLAVLIGAVVLLFRLKKKDGGKKEKDAVKGEPNALEMKEDPICKSYVEDTTNYKVKLYDDIYYFCSQECKDKFINQKKSGQ